jgi:hypothetical protein
MTVLADRDLARRLGDVAREQVASRFGLPGSVRDVEEVYAAALRGECGGS